MPHLQVELQFVDTSDLVDGHQGVAVVASSGGLQVRACCRCLQAGVAARGAHAAASLCAPPAAQLYSVGKGDDTTSWSTTELTLARWDSGDLGDWFQVGAYSGLVFERWVA